MGRKKKNTRRCRKCRHRFERDPRKKDNHWYCDKPECRKASKAASQRRYLAKPENRELYQGPEARVRKRQWRRVHPGREKRGGKSGVSQDLIDMQLFDRLTEIASYLDVSQDLIDRLPSRLLQLRPVDQTNRRSDEKQTSIGS
jgi:hypothetical protein